MKPLPNRRSRSRNASSGVRRGLSLMEVSLATMIVMGLMVVSLETLGAATRASRSNANRAIGQLLAQDLMAEIVNAHYAEPIDLPRVFGPEASETGGTRADFDDVDDFHGWTASPPQDADGTPDAQRTSWRHDVAVRYVEATDLTTQSVEDQGVKEITVSIYFKSQLLFQLLTVRTDTDPTE